MAALRMPAIKNASTPIIKDISSTPQADLNLPSSTEATQASTQFKLSSWGKEEIINPVIKASPAPLEQFHLRLILSFRVQNQV